MSYRRIIISTAALVLVVGSATYFYLRAQEGRAAPVASRMPQPERSADASTRPSPSTDPVTSPEASPPPKAALDIERTTDIAPNYQATLEGQVVDKRTGASITAFRIRRKNSSGAWVRVRDPEGRFRLGASSKISVRAPGYADTVLAVAPLAPGETRRNLLVRMEQGVELEGRVVDNSGRPVEMADIHVLGDNDEWRVNERRRDRSNDDGTFFLTALPSGAIKLHVSEPRFAPKTVSVNVSAGGDNTVTVTLDPLVGATIEGVVTLGGKPTAGLSVAISGGPPSGFSQYVQTDAAGHYRFKNVPDGEFNLGLAARSPDGDLFSKNTQLKVSEGDAVRKDFDLKLGTGVVEGTVYLSPDEPLRESVTVVASRKGPESEFESSIVNTDTNGNFKFGSIPAGDIRLEAYVDENQKRKQITFSLREGEHVRHDLRFAGGPTIRASVSWPASEQWSGRVWVVRGSVEVTHMSQEFVDSLWALWWGNSRVENGGQAEITGLEPGTYTVIAIRRDPNSRGDIYATAKWAAKVVELAPDQVLSLAMTL